MEREKRGAGGIYSSRNRAKKKRSSGPDRGGKSEGVN